VTETAWRRDGDVLVRRTARSVLLLPPGASDALVLEGAAIVVWDALVRPATDGQLVAAIATRTSLGPERRADDVRAGVVAARELLCRHRVIASDE
jgi:hypothetical protein